MTDGHKFSQFRDACRSVLANCKDEYAKAYARAGIELANDAEAMQVQALYILSNVAYWRGDAARGVKRTLNDMATKRYWA